MFHNPIIQFGNYILQPADVIVAKNKNFPLFDHYLVYKGNRIFVAFMRRGIVYIDIDELQDFSGDYYPVRMRRFIGNEYERQQALIRADQCCDDKYHLLFSNCEHFAEFVQTGKRASLQSTKAGLGLLGAGVLIAGESKNESVQAIGALSIFAGVLTLLNESFSDNSNDIKYVPLN